MNRIFLCVYIFTQPLYMSKMWHQVNTYLSFYLLHSIHINQFVSQSLSLDIYLILYKSIYPFQAVHIFLSTNRSLYISNCLYICILKSIHIYLFIYISNCLYICILKSIHIYLFIYISNCLYICILKSIHIYLFIYISNYLYICILKSIHIYLFIYISNYLYICILKSIHIYLTYLFTKPYAWTGCDPRSIF